MRTLNNLVATVPFPFSGAQTELRASGLKQVSNYTGLVGLHILVDGPECEHIYAGDIAFVSGKDVKAPWALNRYKLDSGVECIFVPLGSILMIENPGDRDEVPF